EERSQPAAKIGSRVAHRTRAVIKEGGPHMAVTTLFQSARRKARDLCRLVLVKIDGKAGISGQTFKDFSAYTALGGVGGIARIECANRIVLQCWKTLIGCFGGAIRNSLCRTLLAGIALSPP